MQLALQAENVGLAQRAGGLEQELAALKVATPPSPARVASQSLLELTNLPPPTPEEDFGNGDGGLDGPRRTSSKKLKAAARELEDCRRREQVRRSRQHRHARITSAPPCDDHATTAAARRSSSCSSATRARASRPRRRARRRRPRTGEMSRLITSSHLAVPSCLAIISPHALATDRYLAMLIAIIGFITVMGC
jgi:hypothetical protein